MANIKGICLLLVLGFVALSNADWYFGGSHLIFHPCFFKRCHRYAKCELDKDYKAVCVCPKACPKLLKRVCGSDWKTYNNGCELAKKSCDANSRLRVRYYGPCKAGSCRRTSWHSLRCPYGSRCELNYGLPRCVCPQEICTAGYKPVCGSDGRTYRNSCLMKKSSCKQRKRLYIRHPGHCRPDPCALIDCCCGAQCQVNETNHAKCACDLACPLHYDPVCGSDGSTYGNACGLGVAACVKQNPKLRAVSKGECPRTTVPVTTMPPTTQSLCGSMKCEFFGRCEEKNGSAKCVCPSLCPTVVTPVCGSNGVTYGNICEMKRDSCKKSERIVLNNTGPCMTLPTSTNSPDTTMAPTITPCATVRCGFFARCEAVNGTAKCVCQKFCPNIPAFQRPSTVVCGSDGVTYGNTCELEKASCEQQKQIIVVKKGACGRPALSCPIPRICLIHCDKDSCEAQGKLCCCVGCGNVCTTPVKQFGRPTCPPNKDECFGDDWCPSGKKCCLDGCSKKCVIPVASMDVEMKEMNDLERLV